MKPFSFIHSSPSRLRLRFGCARVAMLCALAIIVAYPVCGADTQSSRERTRVLLDTDWVSAFDSDGDAPRDAWALELPNARPVSVPCRWDDNEQTLGYEGVIWYSRALTFPDNTTTVGALLIIRNIIGLCDIYFDGKLVDHFLGNGMPRRVPLPGEPGSQHRITLRLDNSNLPAAMQRVVSCGFGPVNLIPLPSTRIKSLLLVNDKPHFLTIRYQLFSTEATTATLHVEISGTKNRRDLPLKIAAGETSGELQLPLKMVQRWSISSKNPTMYRVRATLLNTAKAVLASSQANFGLRDIVLRDHDFFHLNGTELVLRGLRLPGGLPPLSAATLTDTFTKELSLIKAARFNAIMADGAALSDELLNAADKQGLLVIAEIPPKLNDEQGHLIPDIATAVQEFGNHPSIIAWSWTSTGATADEVATLRQHDPARVALVRKGAETAIYLPFSSLGRSIAEFDALSYQDTAAWSTAVQSADVISMPILLSGTALEQVPGAGLSGQRAEAMRLNGIRQTIESVLRSQLPIGYFIRPERGISLTGMNNTTGVLVQAFNAAQALNAQNIIALQVQQSTDPLFFRQDVALINGDAVMGSGQLCRLLTTPDGVTSMSLITTRDQLTITGKRMQELSKTVTIPPIRADLPGEYQVQFIVIYRQKVLATSQVVSFWSNGLSSKTTK